MLIRLHRERVATKKQCTTVARAACVSLRTVLFIFTSEITRTSPRTYILSAYIALALVPAYYFLARNTPLTLIVTIFYPFNKETEVEKRERGRERGGGGVKGGEKEREKERKRCVAKIIFRNFS